MSDDINKVSVLVQYMLDHDNEDAVMESIALHDPETIYAFPRNRDELIEAGKRWLVEREGDIRKSLCPIINKEGLADSLSKDLIEAVFAFAAAGYGKALAVYVTAIAIKRALKGWCILERGGSNSC